MMSLIDEFTRMGHECDCLAVNFYDTEYHEVVFDNHTIKVFPANRKLSAFRRQKDDYGQGLIKYLIKHPLSGINYLLNKGEDYKEISEYIDNSDKKNNCVISLIMPFKPTKRIILSNHHKPSIVYQMDPWGLNRLLYPRSKYKKIYDELKVFDKTDYIFTTNLLLEEYSSSAFYKKYLNKMSAVNFANMQKKKETECNIINTNEGYNIVFLGLLNDTYRNPNKFLEFVLNVIDKYDLNIKVHFIGNSNSAVLEKALKNNDKTVFKHNPIDTYEANYIMNQNVFLLNINNSFSNQSPSKLIDYISTGNPIINVITNDNDISENILKNYDNKYNFYYHKDNSEKEFVEFLEKHKNSKISFEDIVKKYEVYTPRYVADRIIKKAEELTK